jgi:WD40 repeat protein
MGHVFMKLHNSRYFTLALTFALIGAGFCGHHTVVCAQKATSLTAVVKQHPIISSIVAGGCIAGIIYAAIKHHPKRRLILRREAEEASNKAEQNLKSVQNKVVAQAPRPTYESSILQKIEAEGFTQQATLAKNLYDLLQSMPADLIVVISEYAKGIEGNCIATFTNHKGKVHRLDFEPRDTYETLSAFCLESNEATSWFRHKKSGFSWRSAAGFRHTHSGEKDYAYYLPVRYKTNCQRDSNESQQSYYYFGNHIITVLDITRNTELTSLGISPMRVIAAVELPDYRLATSVQNQHKPNDNRIMIWPTPASLKKRSNGVATLLYDLIESLPRELITIIADYEAWNFQELTGYDHPITALLVIPIDNRLVSGDKNGGTRIWDLASGKCLRTIQEHNAEITALELSPDNTQFASGDAQGIVKIWE